MSIDDVNKNTQTLKQSSQTLKHVEMIAINTEDHSLHAIETLKRQGEVIDNMGKTSGSLNPEIVDSTRHLKKLEMEGRKLKLILIFIIIILLLLIVLVYRIK